MSSAPALSPRSRWILFGTPMVCAIREDRKGQTRRVMNPQPNVLPLPIDREVYANITWRGWVWHEDKAKVQPHEAMLSANPYGVPGDRLRVKEATWIWCRKVENGTTKTGRKKYRYIPHGSRSLFYVADHPKKPERASYAEPEMVWRYKTARFMPAWASRITLEITDVRVQRVQEISEEDAQAEGLTECAKTRGEYWPPFSLPRDRPWAHEFCGLWNSINEERGFCWSLNPWVWAVSFKRVEVGQ